ncbi:uncharacterized protein [Rutidosis leptorrhynchoides]|uniref:uncharacterized protein n=1 Tax=Rutidosis leptorrhynchoides TaxID=125765 RepID=UPI003A9A1074
MEEMQLLRYKSLFEQIDDCSSPESERIIRLKEQLHYEKICSEKLEKKARELEEKHKDLASGISTLKAEREINKSEIKSLKQQVLATKEWFQPEEDEVYNIQDIMEKGCVSVSIS